MAPATTGTVYALIDPRNNQARYIGATTRPLRARLQGHVASGAPRVKAWVDELTAAGVSPQIVAIVEGVAAEDLREAERAEITRRLIDGEKLLNESGTAPARRHIERQREMARQERERAAWEHVAHQVRAVVGGPLPPGDIPPLPLNEKALAAYHAIVRVMDAPAEGFAAQDYERLEKSTRLMLMRERASEDLWRSTRGVWGCLRGMAQQSFDIVLSARVRSVFTDRWADLEVARRYLALLPWGTVAVSPWAALAEHAGLDASGQDFIDWVSDDPSVREALEILLLEAGGRMGPLSVLDDYDYHFRPSIGLVVMTAAHHPGFDLPEALHPFVKAFLDGMAKGRQLTPAMADLLLEVDPRALDSVLGPDIVSGIDAQLGLPPGTSCRVLTALLERHGQGYQFGQLDRAAARAAGAFPTVPAPDFSDWLGATTPMFQAVAAALTVAGVLPAPQGRTVTKCVSEVRELWWPNLEVLERTA